MAKATEEQTKRARRAAAITSLVVVAFAACFICLVTFINHLATSIQEQEVTISDQPLTEPFYVLLVGSDTRKGTALYTGRATEHAQVDEHSDVMTLMRVDPQTYAISLLTIPRDTVLTEGGEKINEALLEDDPSQVVAAVGELTGLSPDYYMLTTFGTFADMIDAIGGIRMDVVLDVTVDDPATGGSITVKAGKNRRLNGPQALAIARARAEYDEEQDAVRQFNVRKVEKAIIERMFEEDSIGIEALLVTLENDVKTDMELSVLGLTVLEFMEHGDEVEILSGTGPYSGAAREDDGQWVVQNDAATWKKIMKKFKAGEDFTKIVKEPEVKPPPPPEPPSSAAAPSKGSAGSESSKAAKDSKASSSAASQSSGSKSSSSSSK